MTSIQMPQLGETIVEGTILKWLKREGDSVDRDEPLFEISTDKVDTEVPSPVAGTVRKILVEEGTTVPVGTALMEIDEAGAAAGDGGASGSCAGRRSSTGFRSRSCGRGHRARSGAAFADPFPARSPVGEGARPRPGADPGNRERRQDHEGGRDGRHLLR